MERDRVQENDKLLLNAYADVDYVSSVVNERPITGYCNFLSDNLVIWMRKKQNIVTRSSA